MKLGEIIDLQNTKLCITTDHDDSRLIIVSDKPKGTSLSDLITKSFGKEIGKEVKRLLNIKTIRSPDFRRYGKRAFLMKWDDVVKTLKQEMDDAM